jgi:dTDP-4-dehydrorhamnose reductase
MSSASQTQFSAQRPVILVFGQNGQVGFELLRSLAHLGKVVGIDFPEADFSKPETLRALVRKHAPAAIINAAGYTAVDKAENDFENANAINAAGPAVLAEEAKLLGIPFFHYSTDYVFDGTSAVPYSETDVTCPINAYGRSKLEGDRAIAAVGGQHFILRTSWVYGNRGVNFLLRILQLSRERKGLKIVNDQIGCPTTSRFLAQVTATMLYRVLTEGSDFGLQNAGVYNCVSSGKTSWHGFASHFLQHDPKRSEQVCESVAAVKSSEFPTPAKRPAYSVLSCEKLTQVFGIQPPAWDEQVELVLGELR